MLFKDALFSIGGIEVFGFTDPHLALEHFTTNQSRYEVIISDFRMPGMNGVELLKAIKMVNPRVKTVLISAFEIDDKLFQGSSCVDKMLQKPIHVSQLIEEVGIEVSFK
jgi:YesN/AraC family two-component response regulator